MTTDRSAEAHVVEPVAPGMAPALRIATVATLILALAGLIGGSVGKAAGGAAVVIVIAVPVLRVLWLAVRWLREGDTRFALAAAVLLAIVLGGAAVAVAVS